VAVNVPFGLAAKTSSSVAGDEVELAVGEVKV
jgi:hypothetical protein